MLDCVILYRVNGGPVQIVRKADHDNPIYEFRDMDQAIDWADNNPLLSSGQADYQIVQLDEL